MYKNLIRPTNLILIFTVLIALFLRLYRLNDLMPFIGDYAWFYLSARDMILTGNIPLVGITSSHIWVNQGPLWTYLLALPLFLFNFNPLSGAYFTVFLGAVSVFIIYKTGSQMFSKNAGIIAAILYTTSPLVIIHSRMPYHTSLISLVTMLFIFFLFKSIKGDVRFFPFVFFTLGILYNLELATMVFWILLLLVLAYGAVKKERWFKEAIKLKPIFLSVFLFILTILPMIIYDLKEQTGYYQLTAFFRLIKIYLFSGVYVFSFGEMQNIFSSLFSFNQRLVFLGNGIIASFLTLGSFFYLALVNGNSGTSNRMTNLLLLFWLAIPLSGILISRTASEAYVPMLFPAVILSVSLVLSFIYKRYVFIAVLSIVLIVVANSYLLVSKNYLNSFSFSKRLTIANKIIKESGGKEYNLAGKGVGSQHKSFTMNYEYLTWWMGHPPSKEEQELKIYVR